MSKAIFIDQNGSADVLEFRDHDLPPPGPGEIRVKNTAIGVNFIDIYQRRGLYPLSMPAILGSESAGVIDALGDGVTGLAVGDRVACLTGNSAYAEYVNVSAGSAAKIPDGIGEDVAASLFLKGLTTEMLLRQVYELKAQDTCLVHAAAGGVGTILCQWARNIGARIIGVVGSEDKKAIAKASGADEIILRDKDTDIAKEVRRLTNGAGVQVAYDSVGAATFTASLDSLAPRGHMVTFGNASGPPPAIEPLELARRGSLTLTRPTLFHYATPDHLPAMAATLFAMITQGAIIPKISHRIALSNAAEAHRLLESGTTTGSIILTT
ncbi:quinone oxidoreductase family protein [Hyphococcus sp. DH-69]|uniref:quinone oxidoreductase family protein n=1 Tax=Hyphococcus formosus TaxID=3143534 RepID=UPI00398A9E22